MATIDVCRKHGKPLPQARAAVERVAGHIAERFSVQCAWDGDTLQFERPGVNGAIELGGDEVRVVANLGFLLSALKGPIEAEIHRFLDDEFA